MKTLAFLLVSVVLLPACTPTQQDASAREWQRGECNKVIDSADRERCLKRVEENYGTGSARREPPPKK